MINLQTHVHGPHCHHDEDEITPITLHTADDFESMRHAGQLAAQTLDYISPFVKAGTTTQELDQLCHDFIISHKAIPAPLGYRGYPKSICTSVNHVVCHGIPGPKKLATGDIINIDVTVTLNGWHGDTSRMFSLGKPSLRAEKLINVTFEAMMKGIETVRPGAHFGDIGYVIQAHAEKNGFSVVRDFCGHGIGKIFHAEPNVMHYGKQGAGPEIKEGMFFTIEPMINAGHFAVKILEDGWTAVTRDRSLSAQFEHTIGVTSTSYEIFTLSKS